MNIYKKTVKFTVWITATLSNTQICSKVHHSHPFFLILTMFQQKVKIKILNLVKKAFATNCLSRN